MGASAGGNRWSLDHLFLDQDAVPTLVEVKRSDDTRIRREVVGQMLDYAANGVVYWPAERLRVDFETRCAKEGRTPQRYSGRAWATNSSRSGSGTRSSRTCAQGVSGWCSSPTSSRPNCAE